MSLDPAIAQILAHPVASVEFLKEVIAAESAQPDPDDTLLNALALALVEKGHPEAAAPLLTWAAAHNLRALSLACQLWLPMWRQPSAKSPPDNLVAGLPGLVDKLNGDPQARYDLGLLLAACSNASHGSLRAPLQQALQTLLALPPGPPAVEALLRSVAQEALGAPKRRLL